MAPIRKNILVSLCLNGFHLAPLSLTQLSLRAQRKKVRGRERASTSKESSAASFCRHDTHPRLLNASMLSLFGLYSLYPHQKSISLYYLQPFLRKPYASASKISLAPFQTIPFFSKSIGGESSTSQAPKSASLATIFSKAFTTVISSSATISSSRHTLKTSPFNLRKHKQSY